MNAIYDFDKTVAMEEDGYAIRVGGEEYALDDKAMQVFFSDVLAEAGSYAKFEERLQEDEVAYRTTMRAVSKMTTFPADYGQTMDLEEKEFFLLFLRFLFNVNQRFVKRFLCDSVLFKESE